MDVDLNIGIHSDVDIFVADVVQRYHDSDDSGATVAAAYIDSSGARRCRISRVGAVPGNGVADGDVPGHVICRVAQGRSFVTVDCHPWKAVAGKSVAGDYIA